PAVERVQIDAQFIGQSIARGIPGVAEPREDQLSDLWDLRCNALWQSFSSCGPSYLALQFLILALQPNDLSLKLHQLGSQFVIDGAIVALASDRNHVDD